LLVTRLRPSRVACSACLFKLGMPSVLGSDRDHRATRRAEGNRSRSVHRPADVAP
jgi:hypothetical protein